MAVENGAVWGFEIPKYNAYTEPYDSYPILNDRGNMYIFRYTNVYGDACRFHRKFLFRLEPVGSKSLALYTRQEFIDKFLTDESRH